MYTVVMPVNIQVKNNPAVLKIVHADKVEEVGKEHVIKEGQTVVGKFRTEEIVGWWISKA
ncbi:MAG TPA: hypothetical protein VG488_07520 [Candidatus Angelobacter sp.]|jgi:hypothetical protein|nr:hypothetical protein [Candidatus Angelobacter sp.]